MKKIQYINIAILFSFHCLQGYAGNDAGGGQLSRNIDNPWFLENTKQVTYCIQIDENNFGASLLESKRLIRLAIEIWKKEFRSFELTFGDQISSEFRLATQDFVETTCNKNTDLSFQLGILNNEQKKVISSPNDFVGIAFRTDYDNRNLKGRGFIYISPAFGALRFKGNNLLYNPWAEGEGGLLLFTLIHELGHVFGLRHWPQAEVMSEHFPERLITQSVAGSYIKYKTLENTIPSIGVFDPKIHNLTSRYYSSPPGTKTLAIARQFFSAPEETSFIQLTPQTNSYLVEAGFSSQLVIKLGTIIIDDLRGSTTIINRIKLRLTEEQTVFPASKTNIPFLFGPGPVKRCFAGVFISEKMQTRRPVFLTLGEDSDDGIYLFGSQWGGVLNGNVLFNIFDTNQEKPINKGEQQ